MPKQAASEAKHRRNVTAAKWDAKNTRLFACKLNRNTDADLIAWVEAQPNTQAYFKALIRADIAKNQGGQHMKHIDTTAAGPLQFTGISMDADYSAGNELASIDRSIIAYCAVPSEDADEMYGYLTLKRAIIADLAAHGISADSLKWHWEGDEADLPAEAAADADVILEIDYDNLPLID